MNSSHSAHHQATGRAGAPLNVPAFEGLCFKTSTRTFDLPSVTYEYAQRSTQNQTTQVKASKSTKKEHRPPIAFFLQPKRDLHGTSIAVPFSHRKSKKLLHHLFSPCISYPFLMFFVQTLMALVLLPSLAAGLSNLPFDVRKCIHLPTLATTFAPMHVLMETDSYFRGKLSARAPLTLFVLLCLKCQRPSSCVNMPTFSCNITCMYTCIYIYIYIEKEKYVYIENVHYNICMYRYIDTYIHRYRNR